MGEIVQARNKFPPNYRMRVIYCLFILGIGGIRLVSSISQYLRVKELLRTGQITSSDLANAGVLLFFFPVLLIIFSGLFAIILAARFADLKKSSSNPLSQIRDTEENTKGSIFRAGAEEIPKEPITSTQLREKKRRWQKTINILLISYGITRIVISYSLYPILELIPQLQLEVKIMIMSTIWYLFLIPVLISSFLAARIKLNRLAISTGLYLMFSLVGSLVMYSWFVYTDFIFGFLQIGFTWMGFELAHFQFKNSKFLKIYSYFVLGVCLLYVPLNIIRSHFFYEYWLTSPFPSWFDPYALSVRILSYISTISLGILFLMIPFVKRSKNITTRVGRTKAS